MKRLALAAAIALAPIAAHAGYATIGPTPPVTENSYRLATTAWVNNLIANGLTLASGKIWIGSAGNIATPQTPSGDCTLALSGVITCTQAAGNFQVIGNLTVGGSIIDGNGILATNIAAPATPAAGTTRIYVDSTTKMLSAKNDAGTVSNTVVASLAVANQFMTGISAAGVITRAQPAVTDLSGIVAGCVTFLGTPSSANLRGCLTDESGPGLAYFQGGDIGTPSAGVGTNLTALNGTQITTGTIPAARTNGHQNGTATNDNAAAGEIGEYVQGVVLVGSASALTTATPVTLVSISLTAGDWDVDTVGSFVPAATTSQTQIVVSISGTTNVLDSTPGKLGIITTGAFVSGGFQSQVSLPPYRLSLSGTTTVFMVVQSNFTVSTMTSYGIIRARRVR